MSEGPNKSNKFSSFQSALLVKIIIAIIVGIILGVLLKYLSGSAVDNGTDYGEIVARIFQTFQVFFGSLLKFIIPLIVIGLVAPGIGHLGKDAGKLMFITIALAFGFTIFAGYSTYGVTALLYPHMLEGANISIHADLEKSVAPYFNIPMPPVMDITSALILSFVLGFGLAVTKTSKMMDVIDDLRIIINKIISSFIIPLLPIYILSIFLNITYMGEVSRIIIIFIKIIFLIFVLTVILLLIFFSIAGLVAKKNPLILLKRMLPAYLTALGTSSSAATIPVTLESTLENGVRPSIAGFVVPLCATINLSGSMLKIVACSMALVYTMNMDISFGQYSAFIFALAIATVAAPGVPGGAIVTAQAAIVGVLGFSQELYGIMFALYIVMDSFGTATNVTGDGAIATIVDKVYKHDHHITEDETLA